ncbi:uncharacterized protein SPPG_04434 [Spizellomyces punctatus DAOM BR117]|uniref:P-loop containing nucleoside triphosphate hydrolase protein n=1 Tax=Spizellomyces punctatus (strain DAOM BR117) TaxID=645134 RepID=A0A0L0HG97_SPIPD|nr:uncharacterized protein SPPG_04434 [Spizellomyces punctatus DAOM BR117]KND00093.1 hypothetical protein SPPG_04434 [Spizellomyces punctatus DAOM BR117]|eukprot:XP_016608132.1 hypothetical protein SPPG_04434 [Spizellomyces punctatus DAOM BR117]
MSFANTTQWYLDLRPVYVDVIGDFAGTELFVVDGDTLVCLALHSASDIRSSEADSIQALHCLYAAELFLKKLLDAKSNFELAFFNDRKRVCTATSKTGQPKDVHCRQFIREIIIRHLRNNTNVAVNVFESVFSEDWANYVEAKKPYFIMTDDGTAVSVDADEPNEHDDAQRRMMLESMWMFLHQGLTVTLMSEDMFRDNKIVSFVFHTSLRFMQASDPAVHKKAFLRARRRLEAAIAKRVNQVASKDANETNMAAMTPDAPIVGQILSVILPGLDVFQQDLAKIFLIHSLLLPTIPLELRARREASLPFDLKHMASLDNFLTGFYMTATNLVTNADSTNDVMDIVDERLFKSLLLEIIAKFHDSSAASPKDWIGDLPQVGKAEETYKVITPDDDTSTLWDLMALQEAARTSPVEYAIHVSTSTESNEAILPLLPYNQPYLMHRLPDLPTAVIDTSINDSVFDSQVIPNYEKHHWHVHKPLPSLKKPASGGRVFSAQKKTGIARKSEQGHAYSIQKYASSLTGASGRILKPKTIIVQPHGHQPTTSKGNSGAKASGKKKSGKADDIRAANDARLQAGKEEAARKKWTIIRDMIERIENIDTQRIELERAIAKVDTPSSLAEEQNLYLVMILLKKWATFCIGANGEETTHDRKEEGMPVLVQIFKLCRQIITSTASTKATVAEALNVLEVVGLLEPGARSMSPKVKAKSSDKIKKGSSTKERSAAKKGSAKLDGIHGALAEDDQLSFKFMYPRRPTNISWLKSHHSLARFQMLHYGSHMDRTMGSAPDPRVDFLPDEWQRKVLDKIDANESVFVVAPTSAGKTFIAFYAIEKVLRESDDGVVVYVAPTKALVNQIAAEISARFSKVYKHPGRTVWAVHTRDYRIHEPLKCQVLITVPHILQILMLQPDVSAEWTPRLRRIIFDEIHSISNLDGGLIWEQNLILSPSPIVALSATVGNPTEFSQWLEAVQTAKGHKLEMVRHAHRYSDLRKFVYLPLNLPKFTRLDEDSSERGTSLCHLHPVAALSLGATTIPDDLHLEPFECLQLYETMASEQRGEGAELLSKLKPEEYFGHKYIKKSDIIQYQNELKAILQSWMEMPGARNSRPYSRVMDRMTEKLRATWETCRSAIGEEPIGLKFALKNVIALCHDLHRNGKLPAILFNYSRDNVEQLGLRIWAELKKAEKKYKRTSPEWKAKIKAWKAWKAAEAVRQAAQEKQARAQTRSEDADNLPDSDMGWESTFDPDAPLAAFSFAGLKSSLSPSEIDAEINGLRKWGRVDPGLCSALRRGIGIHHAGMNLRYRQLVERWFRAGWLRVVVATGTLALGINMPAATSVFTEDSVYLTALEYRQAAGRAGRRGFDLLGNVVFFGLPLEKVYRLLASRLPDLSGHFPLSTTLVLRLHQLLSDADAADMGQKMLEEVLTLGRLSIVNPATKQEVLHHLRFSIEYLRRAELLDVNGHPINLAGIVSHLYWTEPMNLCFAVLLNSGVLSEIALGKDPNLTMLTCLAHLFGRRERPSTLTAFAKELIRRSPSKVFLEPMPEAMRKVLSEHNILVFRIMESYIHHYVRTLKEEEITYLPLSERAFVKTRRAVPKESPMFARLADTSLSYVARSPFVALSGKDDKFKSVKEMSRTLRGGVRLQHTVVPTVYELLDTSTVLDSYIVDFYKHGQFQALIDGNGIRPGDVWQLINDFLLIVAALRTGLTVLLRAWEEKMRKQDEELISEVYGDGHPELVEEDNDEESDGEELEGPTKWLPPIKIKPRWRDNRIWDVYLVLCDVQRGLHEKLEEMNA